MQQDQMLGTKDMEIADLRSLKNDLHQDLRNCKAVNEKMEQEIYAIQEKCASLMEEKLRLEDQIVTLQSTQHAAQNQVEMIQTELQESGRGRVELSMRLAEVVTERQDLRNNLNDLKQHETAAREELNKLLKRLQEEKSLYISNRDALRAELEQCKAKEVLMFDEISRSFKKNLVENEAQIKVLKLEVEENRSNMKNLRQQNSHFKKKNNLLLKELEKTKSEAAELENKFAWTENNTVSKDVLLTINESLDSVISRAVLISSKFANKLFPSGFKTFPNDLQNLFLNIQNKLKWLQSELYEINDQQILQNVPEIIFEKQTCNKACKVQLETAAKEMSYDNYIPFMEEKAKLFMETNDTELQKMEEVCSKSETEDNASCTSEDVIPIKMSKKKSEDKDGFTEQQILLEQQNKHLASTLNKLQHTHQEREKINDRYTRIQTSMNSLRQELHNTKTLSELLEDNGSIADKEMESIENNKQAI